MFFSLCVFQNQLQRLRSEESVRKQVSLKTRLEGEGEEGEGEVREEEEREEDESSNSATSSPGSRHKHQQNTRYQAANKNTEQH